VKKINNQQRNILSLDSFLMDQAT